MRQKFYLQFFSQQVLSNLNLECFQVSFDIHIIHVVQKLQIFKNCSTESQEISTVKVGYFDATLRQDYPT